MKKIFLLVIIFLFPIKVYGIELYSNKAILYDLTDNQIIYEKYANEKTSIASLTKIMSTIIAIENINDLDEEIIITSDMLNGIPYYASVIGLKVGDKLSLRDLLYGVMLPSGADAVNSLAIYLCGSISSFVDKMNDKALELNMLNTHFVNPTGLDDIEHYSTINDTLIMLKYALNNKLFKDIYTTKEYTLTNSMTVKSSIIYYNKLMNLDISRIIGSKTGNTDNAGLCIAAYFKSNNHDFLLITTNAPHINNNFYNLKDTLTIIEYVDNNYKDINIINSGYLVKTLKVVNSKINSYNILTTKNITKYLPIDYNKNDIKIIYDGKEEISYKDSYKKIGVIKYYYQDELIDIEDIYLKEIKKDLTKILSKKYILILLIIIILILIIKY